ncbi:TPA: hypothetical protein DEP34_00475 [Candidatus Uhrbacteria bacterium]|uniref:Uncharacterized protein n=2 Tax=Candidatus Uhriibacteriota TaxID=1752732 RepID=A0A0G1Q860_9BACT|nr:MAG: hypothetical protein UX45_C0003G0055 [Candidatus Uhrbacteria bacterium GW2011_GWF2_46_218]KKU41226.1 MAG: hypothetical protein UX57_C0005G0056 [Candidatus Uhrbacteria bacterium GW2011_GWE2_46_68]HBK34075.1 hypothetical protein [Candidatus Uhrbacteria bacterium]HCB18847.1 hypothetical protein [Candidatus Uhrbacteria bacterium]
MLAALLRGTKHRLFSLLHIPYVLLVFEEGSNVVVYDMEKGKQALHIFVKEGRLSVEEMLALEVQMEKEGIFDRVEDVLEQVKRFPAQRDIPSDFSLKPCADCSSVKHMHLVDDEGDQCSPEIHTFEECFEAICRLVHDNKLHMYDAVCILQIAAAQVGHSLKITSRERLAPRNGGVINGGLAEG